MGMASLKERAERKQYALVGSSQRFCHVTSPHSANAIAQQHPIRRSQLTNGPYCGALEKVFEATKPFNQSTVSTPTQKAFY
jgi:hypothetical protein